PFTPEGVDLAAVADVSRLVQAALLLLAEVDADDAPAARSGHAVIGLGAVDRLRRAVSAEIESGARAPAAYPRAAKLKAVR
ncbi:hypothetical protein GVN18_34140, partial [Pseudomonas sp. ODNR1LW]|nr:hypothetical protein [Pseudomonas sp. ODNR1LW]